MMSRQRKKHKRTVTLDIPAKANKVLHIMLIAFVLIGIRLWQLAILQHEQKLEESRRPQQRVVVEPAKRATIRDRYNAALALNKMQFNALLLYSQLRHIPTTTWETRPDGTRIKQFKRKDYITKLSKKLGETLNLNPERVEDLIHAKGALYANVPFVLKEDISEEEYYRLKIMEKDWPGMAAQTVPRRYYPFGRMGGDIIGYMGAINKQEYEKIIHEMALLRSFLKEKENGEEPDLPDGYENIQSVKKRFKDLQEHAYTLHDYVGKTGIEKQFEQDLRGYHGQTNFFSDARGNFLRQLPGGRDPLPGERLLLTISAELQEYAEKLLVQNERIRSPRLTTKDKHRFVNMPENQLWMKGGAIVAMDPRTGDVLAMASYPRFDPNDFIASGNPEMAKTKTANIQRWLELEKYVADIWDQKRPLDREKYDDLLQRFYDEQITLDWPSYLSLVLPKNHPVRGQLEVKNTIKDAIEVQLAFQQLLDLSGQDDAYALINVLYDGSPNTVHKSKNSDSLREGIQVNLDLHENTVKTLKKTLNNHLQPITNNYNKILYIDLCRMLVNGPSFSSDLIEAAGHQTLASFKKISAASASVFEAVKKSAKDLFHEIDFIPWRQVNEKTFLKEKRAWEKAEKKYAKPYIDYLDKEEETQFAAFWQEHGLSLVAAFLIPESDKTSPYLEYFVEWGKEIHRGAYDALDWKRHYLTLVEAMQEQPKDQHIAYLQALRNYSQLTRPLLGLYKGVRKEAGQHLEKHLAAAFYPLNGFGYGRSQAYRQAATQGSIFKLVTAYEALAQQYTLTNNVKNPLEITESLHKKGKDIYLGYTSDGKSIPRHYKGGRLPKTLNSHLGKMDLLRAIETSSNPYFSLLAGDVLKSPEDLANAAKLFSYGKPTGIDLPSEISGKIPTDLSTNRTGLYSMAIGQHSLVVTPLQTSVMLSSLVNGGKVLKPKIMNKKAGRLPTRTDNEIYSPPEFPYQESLALVGIDFPLFTAVVRNQHQNHWKTSKTIVQKQIFMPSEFSRLLIEGMRRVVVKDHADGLIGLSRIYHEYPQAIADYKETKDSLLGKTSTSEAVEQLHLDLDDGTALVNHVWFGGIAFDEKKQAELVVVVYLKYGGYGKAAAPLAAQIVKKWRSIKKKHQSKKNM